MIINYDNVEAKTMPQFKGGKGEAIVKMVPFELGKAGILTLTPGSSIGYHVHEEDSEEVYFISGRAEIRMDDAIETAIAGQCHVCPKGHGHSIMNNSDENLVFFAVIPEQK